VLANTNQPVAITGKSRSVGVQGMGGIGKTVLATALARDEEVRSTFPDGVLWVTLGQTPQLSSLF
jgi:predicted ATPase